MARTQPRSARNHRDRRGKHFGTLGERVFGHFRVTLFLPCPASPRTPPAHNTQCGACSICLGPALTLGCTRLQARCACECACSPMQCSSRRQVKEGGARAHGRTRAVLRRPPRRSPADCPDIRRRGAKSRFAARARGAKHHDPHAASGQRCPGGAPAAMMRCSDGDRPFRPVGRAFGRWGWAKQSGTRCRTRRCGIAGPKSGGVPTFGQKWALRKRIRTRPGPCRLGVRRGPKIPSRSGRARGTPRSPSSPYSRAGSTLFARVRPPGAKCRPKR